MPFSVFSLTTPSVLLAAAGFIVVYVSYCKLDMMQQGLALAKKPHVIVATPGRLADHINSNPENVSLKKLKFLVLDEADRMLDPTFASDMETILARIPLSRQTLLFSATMTRSLEKLQKMSMRDPFVHHVAQKYSSPLPKKIMDEILTGVD